MGFSSTEDKETIEKYVKDITDNVVAEAQAEVKGGHGGITITDGFIINLHKVERTDMRIVDQHHWSGSLDPKWPFLPYLQWRPLRVPPFKHQGPLPDGSVAGVVYADGEDSTARKWLFAFDVPNRKIYVEAGPIGPVDWNVIKVKLDQSGEKGEYEDPILGGKASGFFSGPNLFAFFSN